MTWTEFRKTMVSPSPQALMRLSRRHTSYRLVQMADGALARKVDRRRTIHRRERQH